MTGAYRPIHRISPLNEFTCSNDSDALCECKPLQTLATQGTRCNRLDWQGPTHLLYPLVHSEVLPSLHQEHVLPLIISPDDQPLWLAHGTHYKHLRTVLCVVCVCVCVCSATKTGLHLASFPDFPLVVYIVLTFNLAHAKICACEAMLRGESLGTRLACT